jgi:hypothetical protein
MKFTASHKGHLTVEHAETAEKNKLKKLCELRGLCGEIEADIT